MYTLTAKYLRDVHCDDAIVRFWARNGLFDISSITLEGIRGDVLDSGIGYLKGVTATLDGSGNVDGFFMNTAHDMEVYFTNEYRNGVIFSSTCDTQQRWFDEIGRISTIVIDNNVWHYTHDLSGQTRISCNGVDVTPPQYEVREYDERGNVVSYDDGICKGSYEYEYKHGRLYRVFHHTAHGSNIVLMIPPNSYAG